VSESGQKTKEKQGYAHVEILASETSNNEHDCQFLSLQSLP